MFNGKDGNGYQPLSNKQRMAPAGPPDDANPISDPATEQAIHTIARGIVSTLDLPDWEEYPEIGEHDWDRVMSACETLLRAVGRVSSQEFKAAYQHLENRARDE